MCAQRGMLLLPCLADSLGQEQVRPDRAEQVSFQGSRQVLRVVRLAGDELIRRLQAVRLARVEHTARRLQCPRSGSTILPQAGPPRLARSQTTTCESYRPRALVLPRLPGSVRPCVWLFSGSIPGASSCLARRCRGNAEQAHEGHLLFVYDVAQNAGAVERSGARRLERVRRSWRILTSGVPSWVYRLSACCQCSAAAQWSPSASWQLPRPS